MTGFAKMPVDCRPPHDPLASRKLRTALVLASVALAFFIGFMVRSWMLSK